MAKRLTEKAENFILSDSRLFLELTDLLDIKPPSLSTLIKRKSERLLKYEVVIAISSAMNIDVEDVLEDAKVNDLEPSEINSEKAVP